jgi:hypothetical protein
MRAALGQPDRLGAVNFHDFAVDAHPHKTLPACLLDDVAKLPDLAPDQRSKQHDFGVGRTGEDLVDDRLRRLAPEFAAGFRVVRLADRGIEQAKVIVDFGRGSDGGAGAATARALLEGDGRREALDEIDVGLFELIEKLARPADSDSLLGHSRISRPRKLV